MTTPKTRLLTAADLLRLYSEGVRGELVRGELRETVASGIEHGEIVMNLGIAMGTFIKPRRLGRLFASDSGVWLERDPDTVREPDIGFISSEKISPGVRITGYAEQVPDLVVEVKSPSDSLRFMNQRAEMWKNYGVHLTWIVYPDSRTVNVHSEDGSVTTLHEGDFLDGGTVLPGFSCAVSDIFDL